MKIQQFFEEKKEKKTLILGHHNADIDAVSSAILLYHYLKKLNFKSVDVGFPGISLQARNLLPHLDKKPLEKFDVNDYGLVALVDTSTENQLPGVDLSKSDVVIIDHHQLTGINGKQFVNKDAVSTTEIIYSGFDIPMDKTMAELVLAGIIFDSAFLRLADNETFALLSKLLSKYKISYGELIELLSIPMPESEKIARLKGMQRCKIERTGGYIIATSEVGSFESSVARALIGAGADAAIVGCKGSEIRISGRAKRTFIKETKLNLGQQIMPKLGKLLGGSGSGHDAAAGANGPRKDKLTEALDFAVNLIKEQIKNGIHSN